MVRRHQRIWHDLDRDELLEAAALFRRACIQASRQAPYGSPPYDAARRAMDAMDDLAEALTGNRSLFHLRGHSTSDVS